MFFDFLIGIMSSDSKSDKPVRHRPWVNNWAEMKTHERFTNGCLELKTFPQLFQQQQDNQKVEMPTETIVVTTDDLPSLLLVTEDLPSSSLETALFSEDPVLAPLDANTPLMLGRSVDFLPLMSVKKSSWFKQEVQEKEYQEALEKTDFQEENVWIGVRKCKVDAVDRVRKSYQETRGWAHQGVKKQRVDQ